MSKISCIAVNTFRESIRERLLYIGLLFGGVLIAGSIVLSPLAVGAKQKIVMDVGLAAISIFGVLTAILMGGNLVHKEIDRKAVYMILTRPVSRAQYLVGKFAGIVMAISAVFAIMAALMIAALVLERAAIRPSVFAAVYMSLLEMTVMCAVVIFFSTFTTPLLTSFFSLCFFVAGSLSGDLRVFASKFGGEFMRYAVETLYYLLPNFKVFNLRHEAVHDLHFRGMDLVFSTLYAAAYCLVAIYFAYLVFRRREFR